MPKIFLTDQLEKQWTGGVFIKVKVEVNALIKNKEKGLGALPEGDASFSGWQKNLGLSSL